MSHVISCSFIEILHMVQDTGSYQTSLLPLKLIVLYIEFIHYLSCDSL